MPLSILAVANTALAAIQQGCELYKEYKGTVLQAKETFDEVATEVVSIWGFLKNKLFTKKPSTPRLLGVPEKAGPTGRRAPQKVQLDEASIKLDLVAQLKIFFKCQEQLQQKLREAEERSLNTNVNKMESALDIEFVMAEVQQMQKQIRETMVYNSPKELGDLYTRVVKRVGVIQEQQELARIEQTRKLREEKWRRDQLMYKIQSRVIWVVVTILILLETWAIMTALAMAIYP
jgi:hypothetical protein